jgi:hypothetical protein
MAALREHESRVPPHDLAAEAGVLGVALIWQYHDLIPALALRPSDFFRPQHASIWQAILRTLGEGKTADAVTVASELRAMGLLDEVGGPGTLMVLGRDAPSPARLAEYVAIVAEYAMRRSYLGFAADVAAAAYNTAVSADVLLPRAQAALDRFVPTDSGLWVEEESIMALDLDTEEVPVMLRRTDGVACFYRGRLHSVIGEPESMKSWLNYMLMAERIALGETVCYLDAETDLRAVVGRMRALGVPLTDIAAHLRYFQLSRQVTRPELMTALAGSTVAILDGVTFAMVVYGLDPIDNAQVAKFLTEVGNPLRAAGRVGILTDHMAKGSTKGRYAIGAQHKLAGVDVSLTLEAKQRFGRNRTGLSKLSIGKDRVGALYGQSTEHVLGMLELVSTNGAVVGRLRPPGEHEVADPKAQARAAAVAESRNTQADGIVALLESQPARSFGTRDLDAELHYQKGRAANLARELVEQGRIASLGTDGGPPWMVLPPPTLDGF